MLPKYGSSIHPDPSRNYKKFNVNININIAMFDVVPQYALLLEGMDNQGHQQIVLL